MQAITSIGEIGITIGSRDIILRPSFRAIASLAEPRELVHVLADVLAPAPSVGGPEWLWRPVAAVHWRKTTWAARSVLAACASEDISDLLGTMGERYGTYRTGAIPLDHFVPLAASLLKHGMVGIIPDKESGARESTDDDEDYTLEFDARKYVALACVHLGMSEAEAWNMTMTSFSLAMQAKFGKPEKKKPSAKKHDEAMAFLERVNARRQRDKQNV